MLHSNTAISSLLPFILLLVAVLGLWLHRVVWIAALCFAVIAAYVTGALQGMAWLWMAFLGLLALLFQRLRDSATPRARAWNVVAGIAFFLFALAMGLALLPGFPRWVIAADVQLSSDALPYTLALGFPKVVGGLFILGIINRERVRGWRELSATLRSALPVFALTAFIVMLFTMAAGYVRPDIKWHTLFFWWAIANLFFTCMAEEAFFRGFVQHELARIGSNRGRAAIIALGVSALLFGLAHLGGGWTYAIAATLAGLGYGWAYWRTQRIEASMAVHFALNATHFLFFTYPALAPA